MVERATVLAARMLTSGVGAAILFGVLTDGTLQRGTAVLAGVGWGG